MFHDFMAVAKCLNSQMEFACLNHLVSSLISNNLNRFHTSTRHSISVYDEVQPKFQIRFDLFIGSPSYSPPIGTKLKRWVKILPKLSPKSLH